MMTDPPKETPDEILARAAAAGDPAALSHLIARYYDRVQRLVGRLTGNPAEAQDLAQDIFAILPQRLRNWRAEARFSTWLYRVAVNATHDQRRRQASRTRAAQGWGQWEIARHDQIAQDQARLDWLGRAIARLSPDLRTTADLIVDQDMTHAQAARILGLSEGTIAWRMAMVKQHLRAMALSDRS